MYGVNSEHDQIDWLELEAYFAGTLSGADRAGFDWWSAETPDGRAAIAKLRLLWEARQHPQPFIDDREAAKARILKAIRSPESTTSRKARHTSLYRRHFSITVLGGAVVAMALLSVLAVRAPWTPNASKARMYQTTSGQKITIRLGDGSLATLGPATTLRVTPEAVTVTGEAYFDITPHASRPFTVQTANAFVQVLGTRFMVRQYPAERSSRVVVKDGKVALRAGRQVTNTMPRVQTMSMQAVQTVLSARMMGQVTDSTISVAPDVPVDDYIDWTHGRLVFKEAPLRDVLTELGRAYGADIRISDTTLAQQPMTMAASVEQQPLTQILDFIGWVVGAHYTTHHTQTGTTFTVAPGRVRASHPERILQLEKQYGR